MRQAGRGRGRGATLPAWMTQQGHSTAATVQLGVPDTAPSAVDDTAAFLASAIAEGQRKAARHVAEKQDDCGGGHRSRSRSPNRGEQGGGGGGGGCGRSRSRSRSRSPGRGFHMVNGVVAQTQQTQQSEERTRRVEVLWQQEQQQQQQRMAVAQQQRALVQHQAAAAAAAAAANEAQRVAQTRLAYLQLRASQQQQQQQQQQQHSGSSMAAGALHVSNATTTTPAPARWLEQWAPHGAPYYVDQLTMASSWTLPPGAIVQHTPRPPNLPPPAAAANSSSGGGGGGDSSNNSSRLLPNWSCVTDADQRLFFYNSVTGERSWTAPIAPAAPTAPTAAAVSRKDGINQFQDDGSFLAMFAQQQAEQGGGAGGGGTASTPLSPMGAEGVAVAAADGAAEVADASGPGTDVCAVAVSVSLESSADIRAGVACKTCDGGGGGDELGALDRTALDERLVEVARAHARKQLERIRKKKKAAVEGGGGDGGAAAATATPSSAYIAQMALLHRSE